MLNAALKDDDDASNAMVGLTADEKAALADFEAMEAEDEAKGGFEPDTADGGEPFDEVELAKGIDETEDETADAGDSADETDTGDTEASDPAAQATVEPVAQAPEAAAAIVAPAFTKEDEAELTRLSDLLDEKGRLFDEGELSGQEALDEIKKLSREVARLELIREQAEKAAAEAEDAAQAEWDANLGRWLASDAIKPVAAFLSDEKNATHLAAFDEIVMAVTSNKNLAAKPHAEQLDIALRRFQEEFPGVLPAVGVQTGGKPGGKAGHPADAIRQQITGNPAPTLDRMPAASHDPAGETQFAALDSLQAGDPFAYEAALARLTAEQRDAYLMTKK